MVDIREWPVMSGVSQAVFMNQRSFGTPPGQEAYTTPGTYSWVAPAGVTSVSVVSVGAGGGAGQHAVQTKFGGGGGELRYKNNISVTPGSSYTVVVGAGGISVSGSQAGGQSYFNSTATVRAYGGTVTGAGGSGGTGDGGGNGGTGGPWGGYNPGGAGAGGYSGNGGNGALGNMANNFGSNGAGGAGGGGGSTYFSEGIIRNGGSGGGGVGLLGQGSNGSGSSFGGGGGSGGSSGVSTFVAPSDEGGSGGNYGGGAAAGNVTTPSGQRGASGAVRIIWPGDSRSFPSTDTGNV